MHKFAISNIAWQPQEEQEVFTLMQQTGFQGLEIAPTKIFSDPVNTPEEKILEYRKKCNDQGIQIVAMQSLLFGKPDLTLFEDATKRKALEEYLTKILLVGSLFGAEVVVFGSPKNRIIPDTMSKEKAHEVALEFFSTMGDIAKSLQMYVCIETNPTFYGTNFITTTREAIDFVKKVAHPHIRFHLDTGALFLTGEDCKEILPEAAPYLKHCHISEKGLDVLVDTLDDERREAHATIAAQLHAIKYSGWVSIEMRATQDTANIQHIKESLLFVKEIYGKT